MDSGLAALVMGVVAAATISLIHHSTRRAILGALAITSTLIFLTQLAALI